MNTTRQFVRKAIEHARATARGTLRSVRTEAYNRGDKELKRKYDKREAELRAKLDGLRDARNKERERLRLPAELFHDTQVDALNKRFDAFEKRAMFGPSKELKALYDEVTKGQ